MNTIRTEIKEKREKQAAFDKQIKQFTKVNSVFLKISFESYSQEYFLVDHRIRKLSTDRRSDSHNG